MNKDTIDIEDIVPTIEKVKNSIIFMQQNLAKFDQDLHAKEILISDKEAKLDESLKQMDELKQEYLSVQEELDRISTLYTDLKGNSNVSVNIKQILSVYVTLLENVFQGKPHAKILLVLHGGKDEMSRQDLNKTLGFSPAVVLHSIHELVNAGLITYNDETGMVKLIQKIF